MSQHARRFGAYDVSILHDGVFEAPLDVLIHAGGSARRDAAVALWAKPKVSIVVNVLALRGATGLTLVDAGTNRSWGEALGHAAASLAAAGIAPETVERVLLTHLHGDHALGLFDGDRAVFPNAEIVVPEAELGYYGDDAERARAPERRRSPFDIAARLKRLYDGRIRMVGEGPIIPGIASIALPGHSFGHSGYMIEDSAHSLLFWGDALHLSDLQAAEPDIGFVYDLDATAAVASRRRILAEAAAKGWIVAGSHIEGFRLVVPRAAGYELVPA
jgi:glyoxylase-like metal-dependent hydrolase (beta-lactamase superfamily II)